MPKTKVPGRVLIPRTSLDHDWQAHGRSPAPGPQEGQLRSGQAHPPELPAGQAELGPDLKPHPCLSYSLRVLLVAAGMTSLSQGLLLGNPAQDRIGGTEWLSNWTTATQLREEGKPEVVSLESDSRTCTPTHHAALLPRRDSFIHSQSCCDHPRCQAQSRGAEGILRPLCRRSQPLQEGRLNPIHSIIHQFNNPVSRTYYVPAPC